jgi:phosphoribosylglycinamide formyltransferase-1
LRGVGVLISGRGSNLQALIDAQRASTLGGEIRLVVSNVPGAPGLERAKGAGIPSLVQDHRGRTREEHDRSIVSHLEGAGCELVCLAGYMRIASRVLLSRFPVLNIHPSLLPSFPGLHAQRQAVEHGAKVSGATVHFVDEGLDQGPIVLQEAVEVRDSDTEESLSERILVAEHRIYPSAVRIVLEGRYRIVGRRVITEAR